MYSVLFVCTGNQYRSPIAAQAFLQQLRRDGRDADWLVNSGGTWTSSGRPALPDALSLAQSFGLDISAHRTRAVDAQLLEESDLILVMEAGHKESLQVEFPSARKKVRLLSDVLEGIAYDIPDPAAARTEAREILGELVNMIRAGYTNIYKIAESQRNPLPDIVAR